MNLLILYRCDYNKYTLRVLKGIAACEKKKTNEMDVLIINGENGHNLENVDEDELLIRRNDDDEDNDDVNMSSEDSDDE